MITPIRFLNRPKYRNRSCFCSQKHWHQSILEADHCSRLALLVKAKEIQGYEIQYPINISVNGHHITNHLVDFFVTYPDGRREFQETKGMATEVWRLKKRLVEALYPETPYIVIQGAKRRWNSFFKTREHGNVIRKNI